LLGDARLQPARDSQQNPAGRLEVSIHFCDCGEPAASSPKQLASQVRSSRTRRCLQKFFFRNWVIYIKPHPACKIFPAVRPVVPGRASTRRDSAHRCTQAAVLSLSTKLSPLRL